MKIMLRFARCVAAAVLLMAVQPVHGQPAPAAAPPGDPAVTENRAALEKKRTSCRQAEAAKGLRGPELSDQVAVCVLEARLACLKQAIEQKIRGPERIAFIRNCLAS